MAEPSRHPGARELAAFGAGGLPEEQASAIARHLAGCAECQRAVEEQPPDSFVEKLQAAAPRGKHLLPTEPYLPLPSPELAVPGVPAELLASGKYEVLGKLGEGGMGSVWKAKHAFLDCLVAIKVLKTGVTADPEAADRFLQEMRAVGKLQHPRIVRALDAERAGNLLLLVMEYVEGVNLDRLVKKKGPLPVRYACLWIIEAAEGLQHAHDQGLVHRDIKPANLMMTAKTKEIKILDFGLARLPRDQHGKGDQTKHQTFMGTPEYVAPEQVTDARSADIRADIYSLGATLYFLLAGRPPFVAKTALEVLVAHLQEEPPPLSAWRKDVPAELVAVVAKMLAKSPDDRYRTTAEASAALLPFVAGAKKSEQEPASGPPPLPEPMWEALSAPPARRGRKKERPTHGLVRVAIVASVLLTPVAAWIVLSVMPSAPTDKGASGREAKGKAPEPKPDGKNDGGNENKQAKGPPAGGKLEPGPREITSSIGMKLVRIPPGTFTMGSPAGEKDRSDDEGPQHEVEITKAFHLGEKEVTQRQFKEVMGYNPRFFSRDGEKGPGLEYKNGDPAGGKGKVTGSTDDFPVELVSWDEAVEFCDKLTKRDRDTGKIGRELKYRLPTEAEWEYSCRGGAPSYQTFHFGNSLSSRQANFDGNHPYGGAAKGDYLQRTTKVGSYEKNAFGLYDMHGNVWEWCADRYDKDYYQSGPASGPWRDPAGPSRGSGRVLRGSSWSRFGRNCRSASRGRNAPVDRHRNGGFRVALVPSGE
jgi:formylglycine-generating enzyme required for sulfatase activity